ncbi:MAG: hypothetical protein IKY24_07630, partial [Alistipes sp.]|nr:hypothetical protein [Alistipes sp.]
MLDFVLKTFGLGAENEPRARIRGHFSRTIFSFRPSPSAKCRGIWLRGLSLFTQVFSHSIQSYAYSQNTREKAVAFSLVLLLFFNPHIYALY